jgi:acyl-CoA thioesterase-1
LSAAFLATALYTGVAWSQTQEKPKVFVPITDTPGLPRVLLIGDSISVGYTLPVREALAGKVNVHRAPTNCGPTIRGLEQLDQWLGDGKWDLIHFNWGLHDLRRDTGDHQVPIDKYEENLDQLVKRLKATGAKLVWCSTTPVPEGASRRVPEDVPAYNAVAKKIMEAHGVPINDLYAFALPRLGDIQRPRDVHYTPEGSKVLGAEVARVILEMLKK